MDDGGLSAVQAVVRSLADGAPSDEVLALVVEGVCSAVQARDVAVVLRQEGQLVRRTGLGATPRRSPAMACACSGDLENWVVEHNATLVAPDLSRDPGLQRVARHRAHVSALAAVPVRLDGAVIGVLEIVAERADAFEGMLGVLEAMADAVALVLRREREAQQGAAQVRDALRAARHDLKNPLSAVYGHAQLVQRRAVRDGRTSDERSANVLVEQTQRMLSILDGMRADDQDGDTGMHDADVRHDSVARDGQRSRPIKLVASG